MRQACCRLSLRLLMRPLLGDGLGLSRQFVTLPILLGVQGKQPMQNDSNLIWVDMEMTGLNPDEDVVIEIATIVTDTELNTLAEGPVIALHQTDARLDGMDEWNTSHHTSSGLVDRVKASQYDEKQATRETIAFLKAWVPAGASPMCGNTICQDRRFMVRHMPALERYFHYRNLDVSTLKILMQRWRPELESGFTKTGTHLALDDIRESINEMRYYREHFLKLA
jgi:oligoribonuclease